MRMEIDKAYFTLPEILDRWSLAMTDLIYLAENDKLRLSVRVFWLWVEFGDYEEIAPGNRCRMPWQRSRFKGLLDLHGHDVFQIFHDGQLWIRDFRTPRAHYACLCGEPGTLLGPVDNQDSHCG